MKVALVHDFLNTFGGGERVLQAFSEMYPEAPIYTISYDKKITDEFFPGIKIIPSFIQKMPGMPKKYKWYLPLMPKAIESFKLNNYDLVLSDSSAYAKGCKTKKPTIHVCYLHTPTRYLWSDKESYLKDAPIPGPLRPLMPATIKYLQKWDIKASKRPDVIITNSENIKKRTVKYYNREAEYVLIPPVDGTRFKISKEKGDYWLVVVRNEPYKRTDLAISAANKLGLKLKVVGGGTRLGDLKALAGKTIEFTGRVTDEELAKLYSHAIGFIFPPNEDAGITPLEAMASGVPVIAFGKGGALETVVPGLTGEFFKEQTTDSLVEVLKNFDKNKYNPETIRKHAMQFDKEVFKSKMLDIIKMSMTG